MRKFALVVCILAGSVSCSKDSENSPTISLVGEWVATQPVDDSNLSQLHQYQFNADETLVISTVIENSMTAQTVGFRYRAIGTYEVQKNVLNIDLSEIYFNDDSLENYSNIDDLELSNETRMETITFTLDDKTDLLTLYYPDCSINANCIDSLTLEKTEVD
ncbi:MAG: hypothetical protein R2819_11420 [Allomuricauda sp.]